jgi:hypothetical protein
MEHQTFTLTFGNRAENHAKMQMIGKKLDHGLSTNDLLEAKKFFDDKGATTLLVNLNDLIDEKTEDATLLIVKRGLSYISDPDLVYAEIDATPKDKKAFMYGRVVNKNARHNNCISDFSQEPDYENKKGTVINFTDVPLTNSIRKALPTIITGNPDVVNLQCEGNYYYNVEKTFIGFHGDFEREIVIAVRLGADFNIYYQWFYQHKPVGKLFEHTLQHGDIYFMSEKAVGRDWKCSSYHTLRHGAAKNPKLIGLPFKSE